MRKPREIYFNAEYHVTAKINRGKFALESREVKTLFLSIVSRAKKKHSFRLRHFVIMSNYRKFFVDWRIYWYYSRCGKELKV